MPTKDKIARKRIIRDRSASPARDKRSDSFSLSRQRSRSPSSMPRSHPHSFVSCEVHYCSNDRTKSCTGITTCVVCDGCEYCYSCCIRKETGECTPVVVHSSSYKKLTRKICDPVRFSFDSKEILSRSDQLIGELVISDHGGFILTCPKNELSLFRDARIKGRYCDKIVTSEMKSKNRPEGLSRCMWAWNHESKKHIWVGSQQPWYFTHSYVEYKGENYEYVAADMLGRELCERGLLPSITEANPSAALDILTTVLRTASHLLTSSQKERIQKTVDSLDKEEELLWLRTLSQDSVFSGASASTPATTTAAVADNATTSMPPLEKEDHPILVASVKAPPVLLSQPMATCGDCKELLTSKCVKCQRCSTCCGDTHAGTCWGCKRVLLHSTAEMCYIKGCECQKCEKCCMILAHDLDYRDFQKLQNSNLMQRTSSSSSSLSPSSLLRVLE